MTEREAFEAWLASTYPPGYGDWYAWKNPDGTYTYTQKEWEAWTASRLQALSEAAEQIPTSWLDPLLTGPDAVGPLPWSGQQIEQFCRRLSAAIRSLRERKDA